MTDISVIVCAHNPRPDCVRRVFEALARQTLPKDRWELLVVDNASDSSVAEAYDLSWHPQSRHVREQNLGLTPARLRGIAEARGELLIFVDDDNVLAPGFLESAWIIRRQHPYLAVYGAGSLEPEFEIQPPPEIRSRLGLLALRSVSSARWSNNVRDVESIPCGAGLCVTHAGANLYRQLFDGLGPQVMSVLGRRGGDLFSGEDDVFSWVAASVGCGFGIFPELRVTHLIPKGRLNQGYFLRLINGHAVSHHIRQYMLAGTEPTLLNWFEYVHLLLHGFRNGLFSMRCQWAEWRGADRAVRFIAENRLRPIEVAHFVDAWLAGSSSDAARSPAVASATSFAGQYSHARHGEPDA